MAEAIHQTYDTDNHFIVDPITRAVKNETVKKLSIVIDDHNSEIFTFELPRYIEGHDMTKCNKVEVHYVNTHHTTKETSADRYKAQDFQEDPTDKEKVIFSWIISKKATKFPGSLAFALHFACINDITGEVHYWWSTATNNTVTVLDSINLTPEEAEEDTDLQEKTATPTKDIQVVRPDGDFRGLSRVVIDPIPDEYIIPSGTLLVEANGDYEVREFDKVMVSLALQEKEITENGTYTPDPGHEGFSKVAINVPTSIIEKEEEVKTVALDFSTATAQSVFPTEGKVMKQVIIAQPSTLIPENIRKGVTIAGIAGTYVGFEGTERMYIGSTTETTLTEGTAKGFATYDPVTGTYPFATASTGYIYICVPSGKEITSITMDNFELYRDGVSLQSYKLTIDGLAYNVYRTDGRQVAGDYEYNLTIE